MKIKDFLLIILFSFFLSNCSQENIEQNNNNIDFPSMIQTNYRHYIYKNQKKYLFTKLKIAKFFEKTGLINCDVIYARIYNSKGEMTSKIFSEKGTINKNDKIFIFTGNVKFELLEHETILYSDEIELDYEKNILYSKGNILIEKEDGSYIRASSMESDLKLETTKFTNMEIKYFYDEDEVNKNEE